MKGPLLLACFVLIIGGCAGKDRAPAGEAPLNLDEREIVHRLKAMYETKGTPEQVLFWPAAQRRVGFREMDRILPTRAVPAGDHTHVLEERPVNLADVRYVFGGETRTLSSFLARPESIGLIVVRDGAILFEHYARGNDERSTWVSFSVTKSVTSLLIGAAIQDGYIESVDEPVVHYLPRLRGTAYAHATIETVLQMASGVAWDETYSDPESDVAQAGGSNGLELLRYLGRLPLTGVPGETFNYNTGETNLVGAILRSAIGNNAATYLTYKIWQPFGMEFDASWVLDRPGGAEMGGCCLSATLRDYARLGIFAVGGGVLADGTRVLPTGWMTESTTPSKGMPGYGYLWWLNGDGSYSARGIFGQMIFVDPASKLVVAMHNSAAEASDRAFGQELDAIVAAIREAPAIIDGDSQ